MMKSYSEALPVVGAVLGGVGSASSSGCSSSSASLNAWTSVVSDDQKGLPRYLSTAGDVSLGFVRASSSLSDVSSRFATSPERLSTRFSSFDMRFRNSESIARLPMWRALGFLVL